MKYSVIWRPVAEQRLAELWLDASDRNDVAAAADKLDANLRRDPLAIGESRLGSTRVVFENTIGRAL
jgi:hypothetical protein